MRILAGITSYGTGHDRYLERLLEEYRRMPFRVDPVVFSNIPRDLGPDVEVVVGLPEPNPWSLGFAHRRVFVERSGDYELYLYSEDDTLVTADHVQAFLEANSALGPGEVAGFLRTEQDAEGRRWCSTVHSRFHWQAESYREAGGKRFARFTNDHSACYLLTREQLGRAIDSGGYALAPHRGRYDLLCTAATDPYTQCGMRKLICISELERFLLPHLPNRYGGRVGLGLEELNLQVEALGELARDQGYRGELFPTATRLERTARWDKRYYEPARHDLISLVPRGARRILSVGCGWGETESRLAGAGRRVAALTLDGVIAVSARLRGVEVAGWQLEGGLERLSGRRFDCILLPDVLHHLEDPAGLLREVGLLLEDGGVVAGSLPNLASLEARRALQMEGFEQAPAADLFRRARLQWSDRARLRHWLAEAGLQPVRLEYRRRAVGWTAGEHLAAAGGGRSRRNLLPPAVERLLLTGPVGRLFAAQILFTARRGSRVIIPSVREAPIWSIRS